MRALYFLCFLLALPSLAVLGHDIYIAHEAGDLDIMMERFPLSDAGWLWVTYAPESYDLIREGMDSETWGNIFEPVLRQTALFVTAFPVLGLYALLMVMNIIGLPPFSGGLLLAMKKRNLKGMPARNDNKGKPQKAKYKRK